MDVVDGPMDELSFDPFEGDNEVQQQRLARAYRLGGEEGVRRELEAQQKLQARHRAPVPPPPPATME